MQAAPSKSLSHVGAQGEAGMVIHICDPGTQGTSECEASLSNMGDPMLETQRNSTPRIASKNSKATKCG